MRRAARTDKNHTAIVAAFRAYGWSVQSLAPIGKGCPDLLVAKSGYTTVVEVKAAKGKLTDDERTWIEHWRAPVLIIRTVEDVAALSRGGVYSAARPVAGMVTHG